MKKGSPTVANAKKFLRGLPRTLSKIALPTAILLLSCATLRAQAALPVSPLSLPSFTGQHTPVPDAGTSTKAKSKNASDKPALQPDLSIPSGPLGFAPPAPYYLGARIAQVSLNFLDEDHLLFTFRVPGLVSREHKASSQASDEEPGIDKEHNERHIRALVLALPSGKVTAEALWRLHDLAPYIYMLKNQKFLLRDRNTVRIGDASLHLNLFLRFPGAVNNLALAPDEHLLVANTTEPRDSAIKPASSGDHPKPAPKPDSSAAPNPAPNPASLDPYTSFNSDPQPPGGSQGLRDQDSPSDDANEQDLLRVLRMDNRSVMLFSRANGYRRLPIDGEGFYESLRGIGATWLVSYQDFHGSSTPLEPVDSTCSPALDVMAAGVVLASSCPPGGGRALNAITRDKQLLWSFVTPGTKVWAQVTRSENGLRIARETLDVNHTIGPNYPLDVSDIRGQSVQVYDLATGKLDISLPASPILDGGGNFALSPSGNRLAVLNAGAIQIFNLPEAAALPSIAAGSR